MHNSKDSLLDTNIQKWMDLQNAGDSSKAEDFYYTYLFPEVRKKFKKNSQQHSGKYKYLISLVGMSPQPVILTIDALQPKEILFLHTNESKNYIDFVVEHTGLRATQFNRVEVEGSQTEDVYQAIREFLKRKSVKEVAIDITGGKKAMVNGAAEAGGFLGCDVCYVDFGEYLERRRTPKPATEYLNFLKNPYNIFGEMEIREAVALYQKGNYPASSQILDNLKKKVAEIQKIDILLAIVNFHSHWEEYQFKDSLDTAKESLRLIRQYRTLYELEELVKVKIDLLEKLKKNKNFPEYLVLNHYFLSQRFFERQRYDFSVLLLYRMVELAFSIHLQSKYNIKSSDAEYKGYPQLIGQYNNLLVQAFGKKATRVQEMPKKLGFMSSAIILKALNDDIIEGYDLSKVREKSDKRNQGILAHGITPNSKEDYQSMDSFFKKILNRFVKMYCHKNHINEFKWLFKPIDISEIKTT